VTGWRPSRLDALLALAVAVAGVVEAYGRAGPGPGQVHRPALVAAGALAAGGILLVRRRFPVGTLVALTGLSAVLRVAVMDDDYPLAAWQFYSNLILVHTVGAATPRHRWPGLLAVAAAYALLQTLPGQDVAESLISAIFMAVAYGSGILLRRQTARTVHMARRAAAAAGEERSRIARDLHDVISHNVSLMTLHTGGVRLLLAGDPARERERDLLRGVERAGRATVEELRLMLGVLRGSGSGGLDRLDELAGPLRDAGLDVRVEVAGPTGEVPRPVDLAAYRIVQESLTNVLKHARASRVTVAVAVTPTALTVEVTDDGPGPPSTADGTADGPAGATGRPRASRSPHAAGGTNAAGGANGGGGHGIVGMRERVALHGGRFEAGARRDGGYTVAATFPLGTGS